MVQPLSEPVTQVTATNRPSLALLTLKLGTFLFSPYAVTLSLNIAVRACCPVNSIFMPSFGRAASFVASALSNRFSLHA